MTLYSGTAMVNKYYLKRTKIKTESGYYGNPYDPEEQMVEYTNIGSISRHTFYQTDIFLKNKSRS